LNHTHCTVTIYTILGWIRALKANNSVVSMLSVTAPSRVAAYVYEGRPKSFRPRHIKQ